MLTALRSSAPSAVSATPASSVPPRTDLYRHVISFPRDNKREDPPFGSSGTGSYSGSSTSGNGKFFTSFAHCLAISAWKGRWEQDVRIRRCIWSPVRLGGGTRPPLLQISGLIGPMIRLMGSRGRRGWFVRRDLASAQYMSHALIARAIRPTETPSPSSRNRTAPPHPPPCASLQHLPKMPLDVQQPPTARPTSPHPFAEGRPSSTPPFPHSASKAET
jgi:hypothetical protein